MNGSLASQLEQQLQIVVLSSDTQQIKAATASLNQIYGKPDCVPVLMNVLVNGRPEIRQIAAVELRKRISKWWAKMDEAMGSQIKTALLKVALEDGDKKIRHSTARIISEVAAAELPQGKWQDLLQIVNGCSTSANVLDREVGFFLIYALLDVIPDTFSQHTQQLLTLFEHGLADPSDDVKSYAMSALSQLTEIMEPSDANAVAVFKKLIPAMVATLQRFVELEDEERISVSMDCFTTIISSDIPVFNQHIPELVQFFLSIGANKDLSEEARTQGLSILMWIILFKKSKLLRLKLVEPLINSLIRIGCEEEPEDMDEESPARLSFKVLNTLAANVSPKQVFPTIWKIISEFMTQSDSGCRKAAMSGLAAVSEGCSDYIRTEFKVAQVIPYIVTALNDPEISVRRSALIALSALTNDMGQEVCEFHASLVGLVFGLLADRNEYIRKVALETLDIILEHMGDAIRPYLNDLMTQLLVALDGTTDVDSLMTIISAIGSAAHAAEKDFTPFFSHVYPRLEKYMNLMNKDSDEEMNLRVNASDAMGAVAIAVGKETFAPYLPKVMETVMSGLIMEAGRLPEAAFLFFGMMARVSGADLQPYLGHVMEAIFKACQADEVDASFDNEEDLEIEDMNEELAKKFRMNSAIADEKEAAIDSLGTIVEYTKDLFLPYIQKSVGVIQELCDNAHDGVRKAALEALFKITRMLFTLHHPEFNYEAGLPAKYGVNNDVIQLSKLLMDEMIRVLDEEEEIMAVANANTELLETLKLMGPVLVANHMEVLCTHILNILQRKAVCQLEFEDEEQADEEGISEFDSLLISTTVDLIGGLSQAVGESFAPFIAQFWKPILLNYGPEKQVADRSMVIGVIGEIANGIKKEITPYTKDLLELVINALDDSDGEVRSNAAYAVGNICLYSGIDVTAYYPVILQKMAPLFSNQPLPNITDNACGSISRIIMANPSKVPLDQVLPVLLQNLPLKRDFAENLPVYECLGKLFDTKAPALMQQLPQLLNVLASAVSHAETDDKSKVIVGGMMKQMNEMDSGAFQSLVGSLQQDLQDAVYRCVR